MSFSILFPSILFRRCAAVPGPCSARAWPAGPASRTARAHVRRCDRGDVLTGRRGRWASPGAASDRSEYGQEVLRSVRILLLLVCWETWGFSRFPSFCFAFFCARPIHLSRAPVAIINRGDFGFETLACHAPAEILRLQGLLGALLFH